MFSGEDPREKRVEIGEREEKCSRDDKEKLMIFMSRYAIQLTLEKVAF